LRSFEIKISQTVEATVKSEFRSRVEFSPMWSSLNDAFDYREAFVHLALNEYL